MSVQNEEGTRQTQTAVLSVGDSVKVTSMTMWNGAEGIIKTIEGSKVVVQIEDKDMLFNDYELEKVNRERDV